MITLDPKSAPDAVKHWLDTVRPEIEAALDQRLSTPLREAPHNLREAMRYAVLGPGKRLRPAIVLAACAAVGAPYREAMPAACAVEMVHAYSMVHDDLPAMDDDDMRRGRPTVHIAFDEATAILAGDALLTEAFAALAELGPRAADAVAVLARRAGAIDLIGGQVADMAITTGTAPSFTELDNIHRRKTGALFSASCELGGICGNASAEERDRLARYGMALGVAFQYADDRDDSEFASFATQSAARMKELCDQAMELAKTFGEPGQTLLALALWFSDRA